MDRLLTPDEREHRGRMLKLVLDRWEDQAHTWESGELLPEEVVVWCAEQKLTGAPLPASVGGGGWSAMESGLYEALGRVSISLASLVNVHGMMAQTLTRWGTAWQHEHIMPALGSGERIAAICMTEPHAGSDLSGITTTLSERDGRLLLNGTKVYITFGQRADETDRSRCGSCSGGSSPVPRLHLLAPGMERFPLAIAATRAQGVSVLHFVPSMLNMYVEYVRGKGAEASGDRLRWVFSSGESLSPAAVTAFGEVFGGREDPAGEPLRARRRANGRRHRVRLPCGTKGTASVPIGRPVDNTRVYVMRGSSPAPVGVWGTMFLAGVQVARGYLGDPELTAQRFVPEFGGGPGLMYDTGDIGALASPPASSQVPGPR
ncbi:Crotonobetainyl-CoA reductase [Streptomyces antimycoticus]